MQQIVLPIKDSNVLKMVQEVLLQSFPKEYRSPSLTF